MFTLFKLRNVAGTAPQLVDQTPNKLPTQAENIVTFKRDQQETLLNSWHCYIISILVQFTFLAIPKTFFYEDLFSDYTPTQYAFKNNILKLNNS